MQKICIVIPCYNEEKRLNLEAFKLFLYKNNNISYCFVDDGSKDNTFILLKNFFSYEEERVLIISNHSNYGKAETVRHGINHALSLRRFDFIGFFDADLSAPLSEILLLEETLIHFPECKLVIGSRIKRLGANIERTLKRHYMGRIFATFVGYLFHLNVYDSQCGAKLFTIELAKKIFTEPFVSKWFFDIEILIRTKREFQDKENLNIIIEVPLNEWKEIGKSKVKIIDLINAPIELLKIKVKYKI